MKALVIGYGSIGKRHVKNLQKISKIEIIVCTKQKIFKKNKKIKFVHSIKHGITEKPDFAIISNVTSSHLKTSINLAKNGIDLFIEKPLSYSLSTCNDLKKIVKQKRLVTMMGCNLRFDESLVKIKQILKSKKLGKILSINVENGSYLPDWHPLEDYRKGYSARKELGGGVVFTNIHEIDYLYWLFGSVSKVFSITGKFSHLEMNVEDLSETTLQFKNKSIATIHLDHFQQPTSRKCKILGTNGTLLWDYTQSKLSIFDIKEKKWKTIVNSKNTEHDLTYQKEMIHFIQCVKSRNKTINPLDEGIETLKIALSIMKSSEKGRMIPV